MLELFHGPTFAFKDVALQLLGNLFEFFLTRRNMRKPEGAKHESLTVVGATSGDTGRCVSLVATCAVLARLTRDVVLRSMDLEIKRISRYSSCTPRGGCLLYKKPK